MQDFDDNLHFTSFRINPLQIILYRFNKARVVEKYYENYDSINQFVCENRWDKPKECSFCELNIELFFKIFKHNYYNGIKCKF